MNEDFNPERFVQLLDVDFKQTIQSSEEILSTIILIKDFFGEAYILSDTSNRDKRRKIEDKLIFLEDNLKNKEKQFKETLSDSSYNEWKKFAELIRNRHNIDPIFGFIGVMGNVKFLSEETLNLLKGLQLKLLPNEKLPYYIDD